MIAPAVAPPPKPQVKPATEDTTVIRIIPELAARIGLNESVMLLQIAFWIGSPNTGKFIDDRWWTWQSIREMREKAFSYWSLATINRTVTTLIQAGYIIEGNYNERKYDRTRWFALNLDNLAGLPGITVLLNSIPPMQNETRSNQSETRSTQNETHSAQNETTIPEKSTKTSSKSSAKRKTDRPVVNQNTTPAPEPVVVSSVYVLPEITEIDLWEKDATAESDHEQYQEPEARAIVTAEIAPVADSQSDNLDIIAGLRPDDKPLYVADKAWARITEAYDSSIGGTAGGKMQGLLEDGLELRGLDKVLALIASAGRASTSRYGYLFNSLQDWKKNPEPKLPPKPKRPALDGVWSDDGELLGHDPDGQFVIEGVT